MSITILSILVLMLTILCAWLLRSNASLRDSAHPPIGRAKPQPSSNSWHHEPMCHDSSSNMMKPSRGIAKRPKPTGNAPPKKRGSVP